jgi:hypothetical protein
MVGGDRQAASRGRLAEAHLAGSQLLTLDDWNERRDCTGTALYLNLAEVELREALARIQRVARPVRLGGLPAGEASAVMQDVVALLGDVQAALIAAVEEGGALAGSLPAARTVVDIDDARAALRGEPLI